MNPDTVREMAQCTVVRLERALEAMGDVQGPAVEVLKTELTKAKSASKQPPLDVEIDQCRKYISRGERRIKELDAQRAEECALLTEAQERLERLVHAQSRVPTVVHPPDSGEQVTTLQQMVNMLQSERDALAKELHEARCGADDQDIRPVAKKQAVARQAGSWRDPRCPIPMMPQYVPNDVTNWLRDRQAEQHEALLQGDLQHVSDLGRVIAEGVTHLIEITNVQPSSVANMITS